MTRPENSALPPEIHYQTSKKYAASSRMNFIQKEITRKSLSFLELNESGLILDIGCGTGISGREIAKNGHMWIGCDISIDMLNELVETNDESSDVETNENYKIDSNEEYNDVSEETNTETNRIKNNNRIKNTENDNTSYTEEYDAKNKQKLQTCGVLNLDIANGLPFRPGTFDGLISVSCLQWIFHGKSLQESRKAVRTLFTGVKSILKIKSKAVFQYYNIHKDHTKILNEEAQRCGFYSDIVYDGLGRNKKSYLVLDYKNKDKKQERKKVDKVREEIERRKERRIKKGLPVSRDSRYSGRRRCKKSF
ncbi:hypothetical protein BDAP_000070 [Binucleata daphniae]